MVCISKSLPIGEIVQPIRTWNPSRESEDETFQYIDIGSVSQETKAIVPNLEIPVADAPSRARQIIKSDDILVSTVRPNLNAVAYVPEELDGATASTGFCVLRPVRERLDSRYLFHWVRSPQFVADMTKKATGQSYPAVSDKIVKESLIPLPPLEEQKRIAAILDQADNLRRLRQRAIDRLNQLGQAIFYEMFGDLSKNPHGFPLIRLEDLLQKPLQNGAYFPREAYVDESGTKMVHMSDAFYGTVSLKNLKTVACSDADRVKYALADDDLLVARRSLNYEGSVKPCLIPCLAEPLIFESSLIRISLNKQSMDRMYLYFLLNNETAKARYVLPFVTKSTISGINQKNLNNVKIPVPPLQQQLRFREAVEKIEGVYRLYAVGHDEVTALFSSLQHRAFTGQL